MKHTGTVTINTERLVLRRLTVEDAQAMYENWASDPKVTKYLTWQPHTSADATRALLADWVMAYESPEFYQWAIVLREEGDMPVGSIAVVNHDNTVMKAEVGYCLGRKWQRRGIMTEALGAVIAHLMKNVGMQRIEARHDVRNKRSGEVMKRCGMVCEGVQRKSCWNLQGICDAAVYAIIAPEAENEN